MNQSQLNTTQYIIKKYVESSIDKNDINSNLKEIRKKIYKPPKELEFIPTVSLFKFLLLLAHNKGQDEIQKLIFESDPDKIGLVKIFVGFKWVIIINDFELAKPFLRESAYTLPKSQLPETHPTRLLFGKGMFFTNGDLWAQQRKLASLAFHRSLCPKPIWKCTNDFITLLDKWTDTPIDAFSLMQRLIIQILGRVAFAYDMGALDSLEEPPYFLKIYSKIIDYVADPYFSIFPFLSSLPFKRNIEHSLLTKEFDTFLFKIVDQRKLDLSRTKNNNENTDLLAGLLEAANNEKYNYTNEELRDDLASIFVSGHDSTTTSLCVIFYHLARYPDIQKKAREEAMNVLGNASKIPTSDSLKDLKYINAIIMEALRIYPPAIQLLFRVTTKPLNLSENIVIPKGVEAAVSLWQVHRNQDIWKDADKFIPERFMNLETDITNQWLPFSSGPRNCIGQKLSMMNQKIVVAMILLNYEISLPPNTPDRLLLG
ncbi:20_t:CDS:10, partial [Racocetra persica]